MGKHSDEKSLINLNENSILYRIKKFFLNLFRGKKNINNPPQIVTMKDNDVQAPNRQKGTFIKSIQNVENEEIKLLKLQKQFDNGEIDKSQLSKEQIADLIVLYKKQINDLEQSNERRKNKIKQTKNGASLLKEIQITENEETELLKLQEKYDKRFIETKDLSKNQIETLINLYQKQISELNESNRIRKERLLQYREKLQTGN